MDTAAVIPYYRPNEYIVARNIYRMPEIIRKIFEGLRKQSDVSSLTVSAGIVAWVHYIHRGGNFRHLPIDILQKICDFLSHVFEITFEIQHIISRHGFTLIADKLMKELLVYAKTINMFLAMSGCTPLNYSN